MFDPNDPIDQMLMRWREYARQQELTRDVLCACIQHGVTAMHEAKDAGLPWPVPPIG